MRIPGWIWALWATTGVMLEGIAIGTAAPGDTLTETILGTFEGFVGGVMVLAFFTWALVHFGRRVWRAWNRSA